MLFICKSAETGRTLFWFVALVLLFALPSFRFKCHALVALFSVCNAVPYFLVLSYIW